MRALITGGAGFICIHLAEELLRRGKEVLIIDDLSTGSIENIEHLRGHVGFRYVVDTVMNRPLLADRSISAIRSSTLLLRSVSV